MSVVELAREEAIETLEPGAAVEVRSRFDQRWSRGFEVVETTESGYVLRRLSDEMVLPVEFGPDDVRRERRRHQGLWWY